MTDVFTIKTHFVITSVAEMTRLITFAARKGLTSVFQKNLISAKTEEIWDGPSDPYTIVTQTVVDSRRIIKSATAIMNNFTVRCQALYDGPITPFKGSVVNGEKCKRSVNVLDGVIVVINPNRVQAYKFFFSRRRIKGHNNFTVHFTL